MFPTLAQPTPARATRPTPARATRPGHPAGTVRPAGTARPARTSHVVLVALIWSVPAAATAMLGFIVAMVAVWGAASGESPLPFVLEALGVAAAGAAVLVGVYFAPFLRRVSPCGRLALLGALAWPGPVLLLAYTLNG